MSKFIVSRTGVKVPAILYGTAWKKEATADLVEMALKKGFLGIDTACQPKHYNESLVGKGLNRGFSQGIDRKELFIQTKFTPISGQDPNTIPYDTKAKLYDQVLESFEVSKKNLNIDVIDSVLLHSPLNNWKDLIVVWSALETIFLMGGARQIGICNCYELELLSALYEKAKVKPAIVQNRFYSDTKYDFDIRKFCLENDIVYQGFWTLTANPHIIESKVVEQIASNLDKTPVQILFRFLLQCNIIPLTGTLSEKHMEEALQVFSFSLNEKECNLINNLGPFV